MTTTVERTPDMLELAMTAVLTTMQDNLPSMLAVLTTNYADNLPLPDMKAYFDDSRAEIPNYPAMLIWFPEEASEFERESSSNNTASVKHNIIVEIACISDTEAGVRRMARRYGEAVAQVLFRNQTLGGKVMSALPTRMLRSPVASRRAGGQSAGELVQSVGWEVEVRHFVDW